MTLRGRAAIAAVVVAASLAAACGRSSTPTRSIAAAGEPPSTTVSAAAPVDGGADPAATTTTTIAGSKVLPSGVRKTADVEADTTTTMAGVTTTAPAITTTTEGSVTTTSMVSITTTAPAPTTTIAPTTTVVLTVVPALTIASCGPSVEKALPAAVDLDKLGVDLAARGFRLPDKFQFRDHLGQAITPAVEQNAADLQSAINQCAAAAGGTIKLSFPTVPGDAGSRAFAELVKSQLDAMKLKNYAGATIS